MSELVGVYDLCNRHTNSFEEARLYSPIAEVHLQDYEQRWMPIVRKKLGQIRGREALAAAHLQDFHWRWSESSRNEQETSAGSRLRFTAATSRKV